MSVCPSLSSITIVHYKTYIILFFEGILPWTANACPQNGSHTFTPATTQCPHFAPVTASPSSVPRALLGSRPTLVQAIAPIHCHGWCDQAANILHQPPPGKGMVLGSAAHSTGFFLTMTCSSFSTNKSLIQASLRLS